MLWSIWILRSLDRSTTSKHLLPAVEYAICNACAKATELASGENAKALQLSDIPTECSILQNCTGTKPMASIGVK